MDPEQKKQAWITSLRLLAATPKSSMELSRKLEEKGYCKEVIEQTLSDLSAKRILDDEAFADNVMSRYLVGKPSGIRKIEFELKRHRVPARIREERLGGLTEEGERARAVEIGEAKWAHSSGLPVDKRKKKLYDFLVRRGFDFSIARDVVDELNGKKTPCK
jgi:regulatory protein